MIRVLLVDDQPLLRTGFRMILDSEGDISVVGEAVYQGPTPKTAPTAEPTPRIDP
jgi:DNA-binding NarL/FixJ family response regulator